MQFVFIMINAINIEIVDADKIEIFEISTSIGVDSNAISATNMDIVNPMPASMATLKIDIQLTLDGFSVMPNFDETKVNIMIPNGFPITNPNIIPKIKLSAK